VAPGYEVDDLARIGSKRTATIAKLIRRGEDRDDGGEPALSNGLEVVTLPPEEVAWQVKASLG
jgi:hypothetical protein